MYDRKMVQFKQVGILLITIVILLTAQGRVWAATDQAELGKLLPLVGGALVAAGEHDWKQASTDVDQFEVLWQALKPPASQLTDDVASALIEAKQALKEAETKPELTSAAVSKLTKAAGSFVASQQAAVNSGAGVDGKAAALKLLPILQQSAEEIAVPNWEQAGKHYKQFLSQWSKAESLIRTDNPSVYGDMEIKISLARISIQADPPQAEAALHAITELMQEITGYSDGTIQQLDGGETGQSVLDAILLLQRAESAISSGQTADAIEQIQAFIQMWPTVEGVVRTRAPEVYTRIENDMTEAASLLLSKPPRLDQALTIVTAMKVELEPFKSSSSYSAWDAGLILFREGIEALLVLAALLAFLHRTGESAKQKWIWAGTGTGLASSAGLAVLLTYTVANIAAGSTRELIEGITGLVSVVLMLTVGAWLHSKSNVKVWNQYIDKQLGSALVSGNLWSLFIIAFLSILREGAETIIFYIGMAPSIELSQLIWGVGVALAILIALGVVIIKSSVKLPIRPFLLTATIFIYYLVVKFLGQSIHALQVAGKLSAHVPGFLPTWSWIGIYPTWETMAPQLLILVFIGFQFVRTERKKKIAPSMSSKLV